MADDEVPTDGGPPGDGDGGADPFEGLVLDESWVQAARRSEDDAETRVAKLSRIDADYQRLGSDRRTLVTDADKAVRRSRNRKRLAIAITVVAFLGLAVGIWYQRNGSPSTPTPTTSTTTAPTTTTVAPTTTTLPPLPSSTSTGPTLATASFGRARS